MSPCSPAETANLPGYAVRYYRVDRHDLVYLKFILEAYEGMVSMSTVEPAASIVRLAIPAGFLNEVQSLLVAIAGEIPMTETQSPGGEPQLA